MKIKNQFALLALQIIFTLFAIIFMFVALVRPDWLNIPWYLRILAFIPSICLGLYAVKFKHEQLRQSVELHFAGRPILDERQFGEHYFPPNRAEIATKLRTILTNHVDVDLVRMNPTDRFIEDLRMDDFDSMSTVGYIIEIEKEFEIKIPDSAAEKMTTFQSVVDYVAEAVQSKAN